MPDDPIPPKPPGWKEGDPKPYDPGKPEDKPKDEPAKPAAA